jgi:hypothetical protein
MCSGPGCDTGAAAEAGAAAEDSSYPAALALRLASPNPFHGTIALRFSLQQRSRLELMIYDAAGRRVRTLLHGMSEPGAQRLVWDGQNDAGRMAPSGIYFAGLASEGSRTLVRLLQLRGVELRAAGTRSDSDGAGWS